MKKPFPARRALIFLLVLFVLALIGCAAGPNTMAGTSPAPAEEKPAGFFLGLWHGFILFFTFIISLFNRNVNIYEVHNSGILYNLGFLIGVSAFFGGGGHSGKRARSRKKEGCC